jgi:tetratricopeptide (TPR) repeat protein
MAANKSQEDTSKRSSEPNDETRGSRLAARKAAKAAQKAADKGQVPLVQSKFKQATATLTQWVSERRLAVTIASAVIVIATGIGFGWTLYASKKGNEASALLKKAAATSLTPVGTVSEELKASSDIEPFESSEERATSAVKEYRVVRTRYPNSDAATWARIGEGNALLDLGKYDQARDAFAEALRLGQGTAMVKYRALEGLGFAYEAENKLKDAAKQFQELALVADGAFRPYADYYLARVHISEGQKELAIKTLGQVLANLDRMSAEQRIHHSYITVEATAKLLELGADPDKLKAEINKTTDKAKQSSDKAALGSANK